MPIHRKQHFQPLPGQLLHETGVGGDQFPHNSVQCSLKEMPCGLRWNAFAGGSASFVLRPFFTDFLI